MRVDNPKQIFLDHTLECNLRCVQCDIHQMKNPTCELTLEQRLAIVEQIASWDPSINLVLTGGEPFMRKGQMYRIANATKEKGIFLTISTNGTLIREWDAQRIPSSGINNIVFSIDSHVERIHDMIRGRDGTYKKVLNSLRMVKKYLHDSGENCHILTSTILGSHNIGEIDALIDLLNSLEVDNSLFQPIQPVFMRDRPNNWWETTPLFPHEKETIDSALSTLIRAKNQGFRTFHETYQLEDMRLYLKKETLPQDQCNSFHRNIMVDIVGNVRLCFNMERIGLQPVSHIGNAPLCDIWDQCNDVRERMNGCTECCGVMICHAR